MCVHTTGTQELQQSNELNCTYLIFEELSAVGIFRNKNFKNSNGPMKVPLEIPGEGQSKFYNVWTKVPTAA